MSTSPGSGPALEEVNMGGWAHAEAKAMHSITKRRVVFLMICRFNYNIKKNIQLFILNSADD
jgi:hypothetical protein